MHKNHSGIWSVHMMPNPALKRDAAEARRPLAPYMDAHFFAKRSIHNFENR